MGMEEILRALEEADELEEAAVIAYCMEDDAPPKRRRKIVLDRMDWDAEADYKENIGVFDNDYRMPREAFNRLVKLLRPAIEVDQLKSMQASCGKGPITPEITVAMGIRFLCGEKPKSLKDIFHMTISSTRRHIAMFLNAVVACDELAAKLPTMEKELKIVVRGFQAISSSDGIFDGVIGALDGWLCTINSPRNVQNAVDYRSGHYGVFGLNVQAMCDHKLRFQYYCVAAPGKTGDAVALQKCGGLVGFFSMLALPHLHDKYFVVADNAYVLTNSLLIPFSGSNRNDPFNSSYNFFLSQLRIRIEMAFGRLTNIWRIFRAPLEYHLPICATIIDAAMRLHNFIINFNEELADIEAAIDAVGDAVGAGMHRPGVGYIPVQEVDDEAILYGAVAEGTGETAVATKRNILRAKVEAAGLCRPDYNLVRNLR